MTTKAKGFTVVTAYRQLLYTLLKLEKLNNGNHVNGLHEEIASTIAVMSEEDVAWVRLNIAKLVD